MPQIIYVKNIPEVDGSVAKSVYTFFEKLARDDTTPGLRIKPLKNTADSRVRTGRVNRDYRAVLVQLQGGEDATYVYLGTFEHDKAIDYAKRVRLTINPVNGIPELEDMVAPRSDVPIAAASTDRSEARPETRDPAEPAYRAPAYLESATAEQSASGSQPHYPILETQGHDRDSLIGLGIRESIADHVLSLRTEDELLNYASALTPSWQGTLLVSLACGESVDEAMANLGLDTDGSEALDDEAATTATEVPVRTDTPAADEPETQATDEEILRGLRHPAAQLDFATVEPTEEGMAELAAVLDGGSFAQWRVFLHPQQRAYATRPRNGAFRLSGGAGTGKTVVLMHRARHLHRKNADARIVLTTFGRTLAQSLQDNLALLDHSVPHVGLGEPGVAIAGVDAMIRQVLSGAGAQLNEAGSGELSPVAQILGAKRTTAVLGVTDSRVWDDIAVEVEDLPASATPEFLAAEYSLVVLPARITTEPEYLRVRRPGRGVGLNRQQRRAVWRAVVAYRSQTAADGTTDWNEKAMIAAAYLDDVVRAGGQRPADHVLVDEAQDLTATHLHFLRALVSEGKNDLFLAEDSHQRIYAPKVVFSHYGINIQGRSRRLTLNYRTTAQNLRCALGVLDGTPFTDMDGEAVSTHGYRSARTGAEPILAGYGSIAEEFDAVAEQIRTWREVSSGTVGILCGSKNKGERWVRELDERGVRAQFIGRETKANQDEEQVLIMTRHRAKGMEFNRVVMAGMGARDAFGPYPASGDDLDEQQRQRSLIYVAATRARDELMITWVGDPHPLLGAAAVE